MMIFNLIKKDILIVKKYVLIMFAAAVLIPPFMLWCAPEYTGIFDFILSTIFCVLMLLQYVSLKEYQFPKAATLLCAAPFSRKMMVHFLYGYLCCLLCYICYRNYTYSCFGDSKYYDIFSYAFCYIRIYRYISSGTI